MSKTVVKSIKISDIDLNKCYWNPGCAMNIYKPESSHLLLQLLQRYFGPVKYHDICCHHDPQLVPGSTIINNCAGCDRRFRSLYPGVQTISLWEVLDSIDDLVLPQYDDLTVSVHDSCSYKEKPQEQVAYRSILAKMNIKIIEAEYHGVNAICCGDKAYGKVSIEKLHLLQTKRANQMACEHVAVQCVSCIKSMKIGGKTPLYVPDLLLGESTEPQTLDMKAYHDALDAYIALH